MVKSEKYCEECGKINDLNAKFCTKCGEVFFEIKNKLPFSPIIIPQSQNYPIPYIENLPHNQQYQPIDQGFQPIIKKEPSKWRGGGLVTAIKSLYTSPTQATAELLEDPNAPNPFKLVFIMAITSGIFAYLNSVKVTYVDIDVTPEFEDRFKSTAVKENSILVAFTAVILIFIIWWIGSWLLSIIIKRGLPIDSVVRYNASPAMRKLTAYRYFPSILSQTLQIILLTQESNRTAKVSMQETIFGINAPQIEYLSNFSDFYIRIALILTLVASILSSFILYKGIKNGLNHKGNSPLIIAILLVLIVVFPLLFS